MGVRFELDDSQGLSEKGHRDTPDCEREPAALGVWGAGGEEGRGREGKEGEFGNRLVVPPFQCCSLTPGQEFFMCKGIRNDKN